jgi:hypothetical protein
MRSSRLIAVGCALVCLGLVACDAALVGQPPDPGPIGLQAGDLPANMPRCPASGPIDGYLHELQTKDRAAYDELQAAWRDLQKAGAAKAAVAVYATQPSACIARLGAGNGSSMTSLVVAFKDETAALDAYRRGVLGFATPSDDQQVDGMTKGFATGLGDSSWLLERSVQGRSLIVAYCERHGVTAFVIATDTDPLHAKQAAATVVGRIP